MDEQDLECRNCVFVTPGTECPKCGQISEPWHGLDHIAHRNSWGSVTHGVWNEQLGKHTYGKGDLIRKAREANLEPIF